MNTSESHQNLKLVSYGELCPKQTEDSNAVAPNLILNQPTNALSETSSLYNTGSHTQPITRSDYINTKNQDSLLLAIN
jgi:hypothetical protein